MGEGKRKMKRDETAPLKQGKTKTVYYEWIRLIACFFVIFNHLKGYVLFVNASGIKQIFYMALSVITKINVPLFFMVSGALLLKKQEDIVTVLKKRVSRICLVILLFSLGIFLECRIYAAVQGRDYDFTAKRFLYGVLAKNLDETGAYWYLYAYLGFLLMLPFLQKIAKQMNQSEFLTLLILRFGILSLFPICNVFLQLAGYDGISIAEEFSVPLATTAAVFYPLTGYYIDTKIRLQSVSKGKWIRLFAAAFSGVCLSCFCVFQNGAVDESYLSLFDYLLAVCVFLLVKYAAAVRFPMLSNGKTGRIVCFMGSLTFGIYLLDHYFKLILYNRYEAFAESFLPSILASFGWCAVSMLLGGITTWILKKLPVFRNMI